MTNKPLYIKVRDGEHRRTVHMHFAPDIQIDLDKDDNVLGVEVLNYKELRVDGDIIDTKENEVQDRGQGD